MKKLAVPIVFMISLSGAYCQPRIAVVGDSVIDAGNVYNTGSHILEAFVIKNVGNQPLRISGVRTSCGCTAAIPSDSTVQPDQQTQIKVDFNPSEYRGDVTKYVYVMTNDPTNQMTTLELKMHISYALQSTPDFILFQNATVGKPDTSAVNLTNTSDGVIEITKVETGSNEITSPTGVAILKPGESTRLELYLLPGKVGGFYGEISVDTDSKLQPRLAIRYYAGVN